MAAEPLPAGPAPPCWLLPSCTALLGALDAAGARRFRDRRQVIRYSIDVAWRLRKRLPAAQFLEFGVFTGGDLRVIAKHVRGRERCGRLSPTTVHGFDSFRGLPEDWREGGCGGGVAGPDAAAFPAGTFDLGGVQPAVESNCALHVGFFAETVAPFFEAHADPVAFVHADADLYSSTMAFLGEMARRRLIVAGSVICFDEFWNYGGWEGGEYRAWAELAREFGIEYEFICFHGPESDDAPDTKYKANAYGYKSVALLVKGVRPG